MQKVKVLYRNGVIVASSPMNQWDAESFKRKFDGDADVFSTELVSIEKDLAQEEFRAAAADWKSVVERNRASDKFNRAIDQVAVRNYHSAIRVGHSG